MDTGQILLIAGIVIVLILLVRRSMQRSSITQIHPRELATRLGKDSSLVLLDVRTQAERSRQHIKGSLHIPLHELAKRSGELEKYKSKQIVCYCQSGSRSAGAAVALKKLGFNVANLSGGIAEWNFQQVQHR